MTTGDGVCHTAVHLWGLSGGQESGWFWLWHPSVAPVKGTNTMMLRGTSYSLGSLSFVLGRFWASNWCPKETLGSEPSLCSR